MDSFDFKAIGFFNNEIMNLLCLNQNVITDSDLNPILIDDKKVTYSEALMDITMPVYDKRFSKIENFVGNSPDGDVYNGELIKLQGHLFDVPFIYTTITDVKNVICTDINVNKSNQNTKEMAITIFVMCHKEMIELDSETKRKYKKLGYIGNRVEIMTALIGDILNRIDIKSIGKLNPVPYNPVESYYPNDKFFGKVLKYSASDFMTDYSKAAML